MRKSIMYRIYVGADNATGSIDLAKVAEIAASSLDAFTVYTGRGVWMGVHEPCAIIEYVEGIETQTGYKRPDVMSLAARIKKGLQQDVVLVVESEVEVSIV